MADRQQSCPQHFSIWVAFVMGMVIVVVAIVVFDRVVGGGRLSAEVRSATGGPDAERGVGATGPGSPLSDVTRSTDPVQATESTTYLAAKGESDNTGAWLGIEVADVSEATAKQLGLDESGGVLVSKVIDNGPAAAAGLVRGDIIYEFDRRKVGSVERLVQLLSKNEPDARVRLVVFRDGDREVVYVKLGTAPASASSPEGSGAQQVAPTNLTWGIGVAELTTSQRRVYAIPQAETGVLVVVVIPGSAAARADLRVGDLIQQVNGTRVQGLADLFSALQGSGSDFVLEVYRAGAQVHVTVAGVAPIAPVAGPSSAGQQQPTLAGQGTSQQPRPSTVPPAWAGPCKSLLPAWRAKSLPLAHRCPARPCKLCEYRRHNRVLA
jgi:membrane-associated protease RseP (regulator of RpoE activity)